MDRVAHFLLTVRAGTISEAIPVGLVGLLAVDDVQRGRLMERLRAVWAQPNIALGYARLLRLSLPDLQATRCTGSVVIAMSRLPNSFQFGFRSLDSELPPLELVTE